MGVFIGWSGEKSRVIAYRLSEWLRSIDNNIQPFISPQIPGGANWVNTIANELREANFGILCITKENLNTQWIHFEAGAIWKGTENTRVCPLLFELNSTELRGGPLDVFQSKNFNKREVKELFRSLAPNLDEISFKLRFKAVWPQLIRDITNDINLIEENNLYGISILTPEENARVPRTFNVSIECNRQPLNEVWIVEYNPDNYQYWPKKAVRFHNNACHTQISIGGNAGSTRNIKVVLVGNDGKALFDYSRKVISEIRSQLNVTNFYPGIDNLTSDIVICNSVTVIIDEAEGG